MTIGTFDGVHRGHQRIISTACQLAGKLNSLPVALTFKFPPRHFFRPSSSPFLLTTLEEKKYLLRKFGIKKVIVFPFNSSFSRISAQSFFKKILLRKLHARAVVVGYNFGFGKDREGTPDLMKKLGKAASLQVQIVSPVHFRKSLVSSGRIRNFLKSGDLKSANELLGYPYFLFGKVVSGKGLGKKLGFPTANLSIPKDKMVPPGVFAVRVSIWSPSPLRGEGGGEGYYGMCNVGDRPTVERSMVQRVSVEAHLFGFAGPLYGKFLHLEFLYKMRSEKKFASLEKLKKQLISDRRQAFNWLSQEKY